MRYTFCTPGGALEHREASSAVLMEKRKDGLASSIDASQQVSHGLQVISYLFQSNLCQEKYALTCKEDAFAVALHSGTAALIHNLPCKFIDFRGLKHIMDIFYQQ